MVLRAQEQGEPTWANLWRLSLRAMRPFHIVVSDSGGRAVLHLHRSWRWYFARLDVLDGDGAPLGAIERRFAVFAKRFSVFDASGVEIAELLGPMLRPWTFTDADTFGVQFGPSMNPQLRALALAAAFLIDFLYFER